MHRRNVRTGPAPHGGKRTSVSSGGRLCYHADFDAHVEALPLKGNVHLI